MPTAYSYVRFSSKAQELGDSQTRQLEGARAYCKSHNLTLDESFKDLGVSAFRGSNKKAALGRFLQLLEEGSITKGSYLIVENMDRLARTEPMDAFDTFATIIKSGIIIVSLLPEMVFSAASIKSNPWQLNMVITLMQIAHDSSKTKSERVGSAWKSKRDSAATKKLTAMAPAWLVKDGNAFAFNATKATMIRRMVALGLDGHGYTMIAQKINTEFKERYGSKKMDPGVVMNLLRSKALIGEFQPKMRSEGKSINVGEPVKGYFPPVIDEKTFYRLQGILDSRKKNFGRDGKEVPNLFKGLLRCGNDGSSMVMSSSNGKENKSLFNMDYKKGTSPRFHFLYAPFEEQFLNWVKEVKIAKPKQVNKEVENVGDIVERLKYEVGALKDRLKKAFSEALMDVLTEKETELNKAIALKETLIGQNANKGSMTEIAKLNPTTQRLQLRAAIARVVKRITMYIHRKNAGGPTCVVLVHVELLDGTSRLFAIKTERIGKIGQQLNIISVGWDEVYTEVEKGVLDEMANVMVYAEGLEEFQDAFGVLAMHVKEKKPK